MRIRFYSTMQTIAGRDSFDISNADHIVTLRSLINHLVVYFPDLHSQLFDANNDLRQDVPIFVNGRNPRLDGAMDAPLQPDDLISLFSPLSSGKLNVEALREPANQKRN